LKLRRFTQGVGKVVAFTGIPCHPTLIRLTLMARAELLRLLVMDV